MGNRAQRENQRAAGKLRQFVDQKYIAPVDFRRERLVLGRQTTDGIGDSAIYQPQFVRGRYAVGTTGETERARALFEWVRDHIPHTHDVGGEEVTCSSIEVFEAGTGICYAKSHLLAAMMRYVGIPCGFCYQVSIYER